MIASLSGKLLSKKPDSIIVDVGGVGYHVLVPLTLMSKLPEIGSNIFVYTHTHVREDAITLFGFASEDEKKVFLALIAVSGIGPKIALSLLSTISPERFYEAIQAEDITFLCKVPGLGKKTAQRLILELKEKIPSTSVQTKDSLYEDTLSALINLGYKKVIAQSALDKAFKTGQKTIEGLLKETFKYLTNE